MALLKFPDSLLEKLRCSRCKLYLSMAPISINRIGQALCNRCTYYYKAITPHLISPCYIYEEIASLHVFPCQYQKAGCPQYIKFNQTEEHRSACMYRTFLCFTADCSWRDSIFKLSQHYETNHPELYLTDPTFNFNIDPDQEEHHRLIKIDEVLFLLQLKCSIKENKIWFSVVYFGGTTDASLIRYSIKLSGVDNKYMIQLENENLCPTVHTVIIPGKSLEIDINAMLGLLKHPPMIRSDWVITIPNELKKQRDHQQKYDKRKLLSITNEVIRCSYCRIFMVPPIFRCLDGHISCIDCKGLHNECMDCQLNNVNFSRAYDLEHLAKCAQFYCKWKNCEQIFSYDKIRIHELYCSEKNYKCPFCGNRIGLLSEVSKHFKQKHAETQFINEPSSSCCIINLDLKDKVIYIFLMKEFLKVRSIIYNIAGHFYVKIIISHYISLKFSQYFSCEVVNKQRGSRYSGSDNPYVLTVHIPKEKYHQGMVYFTVQLYINENKWIPFDYPFNNAEFKDI